MNFIQRILEAGFVEQGQKRFLELMPHKEKWIPKWWENYPYDKYWFGVNTYHPDAWFTKEGFDGELQISLQGTQVGVPYTEEDKILMENMSCRYIKIILEDKIIYETFSGKIPDDKIIDEFLNKIN